MSLWALRFSAERSRLKVEALKRWANVKDEESVLDLGGGLNPITPNAWIVDKQPIPEGNTNKYFDFDFDEIRFVEELFDVVVISDALYYSKNPLALLKKIRGWLKPDGRLVLGVFSPEWYNRVVLDIKAPAFYCWDETTLRFLLNEAGFKRTRFVRFKLPLLSLPAFFDSRLRFGKRIFCEAKK